MDRRFAERENSWHDSLNWSGNVQILHDEKYFRFCHMNIKNFDHYNYFTIYPAFIMDDRPVLYYPVFFNPVPDALLIN